MQTLSIVTFKFIPSWINYILIVQKLLFVVFKVSLEIYLKSSTSK